MQKYTGFYICPFCEEKFEWEYTKVDYRQDGTMHIADAYEPDLRADIAHIKLTRVHNQNIFTCDCPHCQTPIELTGIDGI